MKCLSFVILLAVLAVAPLTAATLQVTEAVNGKNLVLRRGDLLVVTLPANRSTGYCWKPNAAHGAGRLLKILGEPSYAAPSRGLIGGGGLERWIFRAEKAGSAKLIFGYLRPWESGVAPVKSLFWPITVRP